MWTLTEETTEQHPFQVFVWVIPRFLSSDEPLEISWKYMHVHVRLYQRQNKLIGGQIWGRIIWQIFSEIFTRSSSVNGHFYGPLPVRMGHFRSEPVLFDLEMNKRPSLVSFPWTQIPTWKLQLYGEPLNHRWLVQMQVQGQNVRIQPKLSHLLSTGLFSMFLHVNDLNLVMSFFNDSSLFHVSNRKLKFLRIRKCYVIVTW